MSILLRNALSRQERSNRNSIGQEKCDVENMSLEKTATDDTRPRKRSNRNSTSQEKCDVENMSVEKTGADTRPRKRSYRNSTSQEKCDVENMSVEKTRTDSCSSQHDYEDTYPCFSAKQRRILGESGNWTGNESNVRVKGEASNIVPQKNSSKCRRPVQPMLRRALCDAEPMDTEDIDNSIHKMLIRLPPGVEDIDANITDPALCPIYAQDIINYAQSSELKWVLPEDYLDLHNIGIKTSMRAVLVDWLIQVQDHLELQQETLHLCICLMDQYLQQTGVHVENLQLLGIGTLFVASKYIERFYPEVGALVHLTDDTYTSSEVLRTERNILQILEFDLSQPSPIFFLERLLLVEKTDNKIELENASRYLLDLTLTNPGMVVYTASMKAACVLYLARLLFVDSEAWTLGLSYYSKYSERDLLPCVQTTVAMLSKAQRSRYQAARTKYSNGSRFNGISKNDRLLDKECLAEFLSQREDIED